MRWVRQTTRRDQLAALALSTLYGAAVAWWLLPAHTRREWTLRALRRAETMTGSLARRAGNAAMRAELAELRPANLAGYEVAEILSRTRDAFARAYGHLRAR